MGERQLPLPHRDVGQHFVDQERGAVGHAAAAAGRAEAAAFAGEGDQFVLAAPIAMQATEAGSREQDEW